MKTLKHNLQVYYNPVNHGLHVVHERNNKTAVVGGCCHFYNDAYTNICRYEITVKLLRTWVRVNKRNISKYFFMTNETKYVNSPCVIDINKNDDMLRCIWYENPNIIKSWYKDL